MPRSREALTYRLRRLPAYLNRSAVADFLVNSVEGLGPPENITIFSLASNLVPWERPPTKIATLMFKKTPERFDNDRTEWTISVTDQGQSLIFDIHFLEFTPLSDCDRSIHQFDCIAISGLASHPLGSWMHRKSETNFVWLRDRLPRDMPGIRPIIYGYDTQLVKSESVQTIDDLASSFIARLKSIGREALLAKPVIIIAHSLGGILLRHALIQMANSGAVENFILNSIKMIIFFGVPSKGMHMSHLLPMVKNQPNEALIRLLSPDSDFLSSLTHYFSGIATLREIRLISAYETKRSRTTQMSDTGQWEREGPYELLVDKQSATQADPDPRNCFPINEDHSDMVKFADDSPEYRIMIGFLNALIQVTPPDATALLGSENFRSSNNHASVALSRPRRSKVLKIFNGRAGTSATNSPPAEEEPQAQSSPNKQPRRRGRKRAANVEITSHEAILQHERTGKQRNLKELQDSLDFAERSLRYDKITQAHQTTLDWVFENTDLGLISWLRKGSGIYWIQGKPGSGKSTLMKFLHDDPRTSEIINQWRLGRGHTTAWFFFNERGSFIEKSFEGLLRSVLGELISTNEQLAELVLHIYFDRVKQSSKQKQIWHLQDLEYALSAILSQRQQDLDILLFLDALDEYTGPSELIAEFVQSLVQPVVDSKTKLKVLISSRPWDAFVTGFGRCPGFKMHEQTKGDMRVFVLDQLGATHATTPPLSSTGLDSTPRDIVSTVVDRAEGVFLWVRLVVESLRDAGPDATPQQLEQLLQTLPGGLEELYERTINRIPRSFRLEAFIIIEIVNRGANLTVRELILAASCALGKTLQECTDLLKRRLLGMVVEHEALQLKNLCGGLIDMGPSATRFVVQFMHQTVKDFVNRPGFERRMLGRSHPPLYQNGYSFLTKHALVLLEIRSSSQDPQILGNLRDPDETPFPVDLLYLSALACSAEATTGNSEERFFDSIGDQRMRSLLQQANRSGSTAIGPESVLSFAPESVLSFAPESVLSFAVYANLVLYTKKKLRTAHILENPPQRSLLHVAVDSVVHIPTEARVTQLLFEHGADIDHKFAGATPFQHLFTQIDIQMSVLSDVSWPTIARLVEVFLQHGQDANVDIPAVPADVRQGRRTGFCKALHIARREVSKTLLDHGAHVNGLDGQGLTTLDRFFRDFQSTKWKADEILVTLPILLEHGGCITQSTETKAIIRFLRELGHEVPDNVYNPPRLPLTLAQRVRSIVPLYLSGK